MIGGWQTGIGVADTGDWTPETTVYQHGVPAAAKRPWLIRSRAQPAWLSGPAQSAAGGSFTATFMTTAITSMTAPTTAKPAASDQWANPAAAMGPTMKAMAWALLP